MGIDSVIFVMYAAIRRNAAMTSSRAINLVQVRRTDLLRLFGAFKDRVLPAVIRPPLAFAHRRNFMRRLGAASCLSIIPGICPFIICSTIARCSGGMLASCSSICLIASLIFADTSSSMASSMTM